MATALIKDNDDVDNSRAISPPVTEGKQNPEITIALATANDTTAGNDDEPSFGTKTKNYLAADDYRRPKNTAAVIILGLSSYYLTGLTLNPALIPFGLAAITSVVAWWSAVVIVALIAATAGVYLTKDIMLDFVNRAIKNQMTLVDTTLMLATLLTSLVFLGAMVFAPALIPFGLGALSMGGTVAVNTTAVVAATGSAAALAYKFFAPCFADKKVGDEQPLLDDNKGTELSPTK